MDKACFQHDMTYDKYKELEKRTQSEALAITSNPKYVGYQRGLVSIVYKLFDKKLERSGIKNEIQENQQLANELYKPIIRKFKKRKLYSSFKDNILRC